jgi:putative endonuclease
MPGNTRMLGKLGEEIAAAFLRMKGYRVLARNYVYARREIDLIVARGACLAAVEVKLRRGTTFGRAIEAIDERKLKRLRIALEAFLRSRRERLEPRIDFVVIDVSLDSSEMKVSHLEGMY